MGKGFGVKKLSNKDYYNFLDKVLRTIRRKKDSQKQQRAVNQILEANLDKLDDQFAQRLRIWEEAKLSAVDSWEARRIARNINNFCNQVANLPGLKPENKWEIVITGYEVSTAVFTPEKYPKDWLILKNSLGIAYCQQKQIDEAIAILKAALESYPPEEFYQKFPDEWAMLQHSLGKTYCCLPGDKTQNLDLAIACYEEALRNTPKDKFPYEWAQTKHNVCSIHYQQGKSAQAITCYKSLLQEVYTEDAFPYEWAQVQNSLGLAYSDEGNFDKAIDYFRSALKILTPIVYPEDCLNAGRSLGYEALKASCWQEAIEGYGIAIEAVEQQRYIWAKTDTQRQKIQGQEIDVYIGIVKACIKNNQLTKAIEYVEHSKARNLVELIVSLSFQPKGVSKDIRNEFNRLRQEITARQSLLDIEVELRQLRANSRESDESDCTQLNQLQQKLNELQEQFDSLIIEKIQPHDPSVSVTQQVKGISFQEIQTLLPDTKTALIEWYILDDIFVAFIITHQNPGITVWQSSSEELQNLRSWGNEYLGDYGKPCQTDWKDSLELRLNTSHIIAKSDAKKSAIDNQQFQTPHCVHFSCHGYFNFEKPLLSELHLADCHITIENSPAIDLTKCLTLAEIFTLDLSQCRLVTLSACETGLIDLTSLSDEYIGLPNGFLVAGSPSVVSSLWRVNELSTALLMIKFYQNLKSSSTVPLALNQAQTWLRDATKEQLQQWASQLPLDDEQELQLDTFFYKLQSNSKPFESPYHWAAFCAIGQ
ncbi:MAG: CHAT domain-containing protein [Symploca sp. SIO2D2]|nr:CHAT domain-containing protein [Symploca sp. SIO2D2]